MRKIYHEDDATLEILENKTVSIRRRFEGNLGELKLNDFILKTKQEIDNKDRRNSK